MKPPAKFIVATTSLLKNLLRIDIDEDNHNAVFTIGIDGLLNCNGKDLMIVDDVTGSGVFTFHFDSVRKLITCLKSLDETPIVIEFCDYIRILEIIF